MVSLDVSLSVLASEGAADPSAAPPGAAEHAGAGFADLLVDLVAAPAVDPQDTFVPPSAPLEIPADAACKAARPHALVPGTALLAPATPSDDGEQDDERGGTGVMAGWGPPLHLFLPGQPEGDAAAGTNTGARVAACPGHGLLDADRPGLLMHVAAAPAAAEGNEAAPGIPGPGPEADPPPDNPPRLPVPADASRAAPAAPARAADVDTTAAQTPPALHVAQQVRPTQDLPVPVPQHEGRGVHRDMPREVSRSGPPSTVRPEPATPADLRADGIAVAVAQQASPRERDAGAEAHRFVPPARAVGLKDGVPALVHAGPLLAQAGSASALPPGHAEASVPVLQPAEIRDQIVQAVRMAWQGNAGEARITLRPDYLGAVTISVRVVDGAATAVLQIEEPHVRAWVQANEPLLRQGLSDQGLTLERLIITGDDGRREGRHDDGDPRRRSGVPARRFGRADAPRFEIVL